MLSNTSRDTLNTVVSHKDHTNIIREAFYQYDDWNDSMHQRWSEWLRSYKRVIDEDGQRDVERLSGMRVINPKFIFRNYLAQLAIDDIESGSTAVLERLHDVLRAPFDEHPEHEEWAGRMPDWARNRAGCTRTVRGAVCLVDLFTPSGLCFLLFSRRTCRVCRSGFPGRGRPCSGRSIARTARRRCRRP